MNKFPEAIGSVAAERQRQEDKWGASELRDPPSLAVLVEEVGEVAQAMLEHNPEEIRTELVHVAAVAVAMIEACEREEVPYR